MCSSDSIVQTKERDEVLSSNHTNMTMKQHAKRPSLRPSHSFSEVSRHMFTGTLLSLLFFVFASYMPFFLAPSAAEATYHFASYDYDVDLTHFDNSVWTWATDYVLALAMAALIWSFPKTKFSCKKEEKRSKVSTTTTTTTTTSVSHVQVVRTQAMLMCYLLSVVAGGIAHQFYTTIESRTHWSFRLLWNICVGTVAAAPAFMGSIATELNHLDWEFRSIQSSTQQYKLISFDKQGAVVLPCVPTWFWVAYAICSTSIVIWGGMSYQRPAADIFIAGIMQAPSTFYVMAIFGYGLLRHPISNWTRIWGTVGFILNAPLLPMYPLLVQYTDWSLASVNTLLHCWLLVSWSTQGLCLRSIALALEKYETHRKGGESSGSKTEGTSAQEHKTN
mmetsp:Transcript_10812/g.29888  ORF Transcript_10812/g.29888 Transcript_10812/m.29888 type:complete len:390 (+) Transcript_10812:200-1369(+)